MNAHSEDTGGSPKAEDWRVKVTIDYIDYVVTQYGSNPRQFVVDPVVRGLRTWVDLGKYEHYSLNVLRVASQHPNFWREAVALHSWLTESHQTKSELEADRLKFKNN